MDEIFVIAISGNDKTHFAILKKIANFDHLKPFVAHYVQKIQILLKIIG
jgi:hypothetical protein